MRERALWLPATLSYHIGHAAATFRGKKSETSHAPGTPVGIQWWIGTVESRTVATGTPK